MALRLRGTELKRAETARDVGTIATLYSVYDGTSVRLLKETNETIKMIKRHGIHEEKLMSAEMNYICKTFLFLAVLCTLHII